MHFLSTSFDLCISVLINDGGACINKSKTEAKDGAKKTQKSRGKVIKLHNMMIETISVCILFLIWPSQFIGLWIHRFVIHRFMVLGL